MTGGGSLKKCKRNRSGLILGDVQIYLRNRGVMSSVDQNEVLLLFPVLFKHPLKNNAYGGEGRLPLNNSMKT